MISHIKMSTFYIHVLKEHINESKKNKNSILLQLIVF